ncbi:YrvL family regulatory protein [Oceanobacillus sp. Castelsardo]|uniref:YrvL family regulatory protein n=1 Tax=Oceanobacillus sp. Castelsardo TaxID=1851204 RepID=UPI000837F3C3|nr:YrvL family regulatory protein [Oceanobacillus sp. Castelsardo]
MKKNGFFRGFKIFGGNLIAVALLGLVIIASLLLIIGTYFFGFAGFFYIFNVKYDSLYFLLLFLVFFFILSYFTKLIAKLSLIIFAPYLKSKKRFMRMSFILHSFALWLAIFIIDEMMVQITVPIGTEILGAFLLSIADIAFKGKMKKIVIVKKQ